ncbi:hypothetical protein BH09PSE5_BH09PSE5_16980 [soil metagenome]
MLMAQRPGQLRKLFESLGGPASEMDIGAVVAELSEHLASGGTLAQFGVKRALDPTTLYLLAVQSRISQGSIKSRASHRLERETDELLVGHEAEIGAALNTSKAMRTLAGSASDRMWMRSLYVAAITVRSPINETFESLLQRFGTSGFERGAATLLRALSDDLAAQRSSVAPDRLQGLLLASLVSMRHVLGLIHSTQAFLGGQGLKQKASVRRVEKSSEADVERRFGRPEDGRAGDHGAGDERPGEKSEGSRSGFQRVASNDAAVSALLSAQHQRIEDLTVQLVRLLLQLAASSNAVRAVPSFLNQEVGAGMESRELVRLRAQFIELIRALPTSLWKEANHKDHLLDTLRRQFEAEMIAHALPTAPPNASNG